MVKVGNAPPRKIFLSSIRPPREAAKLVFERKKKNYAQLLFERLLINCKLFLKF